MQRRVVDRSKIEQNRKEGGSPGPPPHQNRSKNNQWSMKTCCTITSRPTQSDMRHHEPRPIVCSVEILDLVPPFLYHLHILLQYKLLVQDLKEKWDSVKKKPTFFGHVHGQPCVMQVLYVHSNYLLFFLLKTMRFRQFG